MSAPVSAGQPRRKQVRLDLQGMRGIGILLVVFGHLFRQPQGVFAALDIFFVLSGFLITGILIDVFDQRGRIYFIPFYLSRFRRLIPTAVVVIVVTVVATYLLYSTARGQLVADDGLWALLLAANWHFAIEGTNYFATGSESPLLHYWSLSLEEQFYAVWPLLLLGTLVLARRLRFNREAVVLTVMAMIALASFAYSLRHSADAPIQAYYSTFDRVWEFAIGGMLAAARPQLARIPPLAGSLLGWFGVLGLLPTIFLLHYGVAFPAPWAGIPVLMTAAVVAGGVDKSRRTLPVLENRPLVYVGDISYSMYLWHMPINVLSKPFFAPESVAYYTWVLAATGVVSVLSFHLLERPMRYAPWLMTPPERRLYSRALAKRRAGMRRVGLGWLAIGLTGVMAFVGVTVLSPTPTAPTPTFAASRTKASHSPDALVDRQQARLSAALGATQFPQFDPPLDHLGLDHWAKDQAASGCSASADKLTQGCKFGDPDAKKLAVVIGDSFAVAWTPGVRKALVPRGWAVQRLTMAECPGWTLPSYVHEDGTPFPECRDHHRAVDRFVKQERPDLVIVADSQIQVRNAERPTLHSTQIKVARDGLTATLHQLARHGTRLAVLQPPPGTGSLLDCVTRQGSPQDCVGKPDSFWANATQGEKAAAGTEPSADYVSTRDWFCSDGQCPAFVGRTPVTVDGSHLSIQYSEQLGPLLRQALLAH